MQCMQYVGWGKHWSLGHRNSFAGLGQRRLPAGQLDSVQFQIHIEKQQLVGNSNYLYNNKLCIVNTTH